MTTRAVVSDDSTEIALVAYRGTEAISVELDPMAAIALARDLIEVAHRHLQREAGGSSDKFYGKDAITTDPRARGNQALVELRTKFFADLKITRAADEIATRGRRYETSAWRSDQQGPSDIGDEQHQLFAEVLRGRSHFPGPRQVRNLLRLGNREIGKST
jgi:hypothetical protein